MADVLKSLPTRNGERYGEAVPGVTYEVESMQLSGVFTPRKSRLGPRAVESWHATSGTPARACRSIRPRAR